VWGFRAKPRKTGVSCFQGLLPSLIKGWLKLPQEKHSFFVIFSRLNWCQKPKKSKIFGGGPYRNVVFFLSFSCFFRFWAVTIVYVFSCKNRVCAPKFQENHPKRPLFSPFYWFLDGFNRRRFLSDWLHPKLRFYFLSYFFTECAPQNRKRRPFLWFFKKNAFLRMDARKFL